MHQGETMSNNIQYNEHGLMDKQELFCQHLTTDPDRVRWKAYQKAYPDCKSDKAAMTASSRLLRNVKIQARIAALDKPSMDKFELTRERINEEKAKICFFDPRKLFHKTGIPKEMHELDDEIAPAVADLKTERRYEKGQRDEDGEIVITTTVKMQPKVPMLDQVSKQLGMYDQDNRQKSGTMDELLDAVDGKTRGLPSDHVDHDDEEE